VAEYCHACCCLRPHKQGLPCVWCLTDPGLERQHVGVLIFDSAMQSYSFNVDRTSDQMLLVSSGHLLVSDGKENPAAFWQSLLTVVFRFAGVERQHVGIVTFDSAIHFYSFNADRTGYHMLLVPDGEKPFAPAATSSLVVPLQSAIDAVSNNLAIPGSRQCSPATFRSSWCVSEAAWMSAANKVGSSGSLLQCNPGPGVACHVCCALANLELCHMGHISLTSATACSSDWSGVHLTLRAYCSNCACSAVNESSVGMFCTTCNTCPESMLMSWIGDRFL